MFGEWSIYTVSVGNSDCGTTSGRTERIFPVAGDIVIVAGETIRLPCASEMTALLETRTVWVASCVPERVVGAISRLCGNKAKKESCDLESCFSQTKVGSEKTRCLRCRKHKLGVWDDGDWKELYNYRNFQTRQEDMVSFIRNAWFSAGGVVEWACLQAIRCLG